MTTPIVRLSDCVAYVESRNNPLAMRYEPAYQPNENAVQKITTAATDGWIDQLTAQIIAKTSWGQFQIMGDNLYLQGYGGTLADFLTQSTFQYEAFMRFISKLGYQLNPPFASLTQSELNNFAVDYNGSLVYADSLKQAYISLSNS